MNFSLFSFVIIKMKMIKFIRFRKLKNFKKDDDQDQGQDQNQNNAKADNDGELW
jgi:hypothetical protein